MSNIEYTIGTRVIPKEHTLKRYSEVLTKGKIYTVESKWDTPIVRADRGTSYWSLPHLSFNRIPTTFPAGGEIL